jgi:hypothetical protein
MLFAILFGAIVGGLVDATLTFEDCKKLNFEPKACSVQKELYKLGEKK